MLNQEVTQIINNLKGRRGYEEKRKKIRLYLYDYFEDKLKKQQLAIKNEKAVARQELIQKEIAREKKYHKTNVSAADSNSNLLIHTVAL